MRAVEDRGFNRGLFARHLTRLAGALAALATTAAHAQMSTPILNPATGNYYAYVTAPGAVRSRIHSWSLPDLSEMK